MERLPQSIAFFALLTLAACSVSFVGGDGGIPPSQFQFQSIIESDDPEPGGWKVARVIINLARVSGKEVKYVPCEVQVEVPETNFVGGVTNESAQQAAARAANRASERVIPSQGLLSAELCEKFRTEMMQVMKKSIPGVRIRRFIDFWGDATGSEPLIVWSVR